MALRAWLRAFALSRPRWGWRRAAVMARSEGWRVNNKRIQRLWRAEGLKVPYRKRKKPLRGKGVVMGAMCPIRPNVLWALDFQFDQTANGRTLKLLNVIDEFTRECPAIEVARNIDADGVVSCLERIAAERGAPMYLRFDNGPEFIANAVADWCRFNGTGTVFIDPGSPWQNAWIESFNGRLRDEFLNGHRFDSLLRGPGAHRGLENRLQHEPSTQRARLAQPQRVRPSMDQPTPTPTHVRAGPTIGIPSICRQSPRFASCRTQGCTLRRVRVHCVTSSGSRRRGQVSETPPWELLGQRPGSSEWIEVVTKTYLMPDSTVDWARVGPYRPASREQFRLKVSWRSVRSALLSPLARCEHHK